MSDTFVDDVELEGPVDDGQADQVDEAEDVVEEELSYLDLDNLGGHLVRAKVDGEEVEIPLSEALAGYQRQADYTRKTQELAAQRADLQWGAAIKAAMEHDPQGTLQLLAANFGVTPQSQPQANDPFDFGNEGDQWDDPATAQIRSLEQRISSFEEAQAQARLENEIGRLSTKYGDEFDPTEVVTEALRSGSSNLEATFKQIAFDRVMEKQRHATAAAETKTAKTQAKRAAAVVVGGSSAGSGQVDIGTIHSITDAWNAAKRQLAS